MYSQRGFSLLIWANTARQLKTTYSANDAASTAIGVSSIITATKHKGNGRFAIQMAQTEAEIYYSRGRSNLADYQRAMEDYSKAINLE